MPFSSQDSKTQTMTVGEFVSGLPHLRLQPDLTVETVLSLMACRNKRVGAVINEAGKLLGFVTRKRMLHHLSIGQNLHADTMTISQIMIPDPAFLPSEIDIADSLAIMGEYGFQAMPVLGDGGKLIGIAEMRDLMQAERIQAEKDANHAGDFLADLIFRDVLGPGSSRLK